jgi:hypothetical protein
MPTPFYRERWACQLQALDREIERACRTHLGWPRCECHLCQALGLVGDALWHLDRLGQPPPAAA